MSPCASLSLSFPDCRQGDLSPGVPFLPSALPLSCRSHAFPCLPAAPAAGKRLQSLAQRRFAGYDRMTHFMGFSVVAFCRPF